MTGRVLKIQRFSLEDGAGIRTTVFLKGCPMRCRFCHNPESQSLSPEIATDTLRCAGCGKCVAACPRGARLMDGGKVRTDPARCDLCAGRPAACAAVCPVEAVVRYGEEMTVDVVLEEVLRDVVFYRTSGGGVTLSGGEVLAQPAFARALLAACREHGVQTAIETGGGGRESDFLSLLPLCDFVYFDIKAREEDYPRMVGMRAAGVLQNLRHLEESGVPYVLRLPLVPGENDDDAALRAAAALSCRAPSCLGAEMMFYHTLGVYKYETLSRTYCLPDAREYTGEEKAAKQAAFISFGGRLFSGNFPK